MLSLRVLHRNHFLVALSIVAFLIMTACGTTQANQSATRNFVIGEVSVLPITYTSALHASLAQLGYIEGKNVSFLPSNAATPAATANGSSVATAATAGAPAVSPNSLLTVAQSLVAAKVDLIVAYGTTSATAAQKAVAGTNIPIVFVGALDPVGQGLVKSLSNTEGNITGVSAGSDAYAKQLEWLLKFAPNIKRVYVPYAPGPFPAIKIALKSIQDFATKSGIQVTATALSTPQDVAAALANPPDTDAIMFIPFGPQQNDFTNLAIRRKLPASGYVTANATGGALFSYNYSETTLSNAAAPLIDAILKGAKPSNFPIQLASNSLVINLKTAQAIGITIPDVILQQAATVIR